MNTTGSGLCKCGCGKPTTLAPYSAKGRSWVKGEPQPYRKGHSGWTKNYGPRWIVDENGCWVWQRTVNSTGYGMGSMHGKHGYAHRLMYELHVGPIPPGYHVDHLCRVPACVNPAHLEPVTPRENARRGAATRILDIELAPLYAEWQAGVSLRVLGERVGLKHSQLGYRLKTYAADHGLRDKPRVQPVHGEMSHRKYR